MYSCSLGFVLRSYDLRYPVSMIFRGVWISLGLNKRPTRGAVGTRPLLSKASRTFFLKRVTDTPWIRETYRRLVKGRCSDGEQEIRPCKLISGSFLGNSPS